MAERLRQFVPDKTSHNLLRLFHFSVPQSQIEIEQTGRKESLAHSRSGQPIIGSTVKTEQSDDRTLPDILKMWLRENHYKLLMLPALTRYYSSFAPGVEPGFAALVAPDLIVFQLSKPCANAKLKQINRNETSFNPAKDEDLFFELSAETGESERMNNGLDCWSGTVLIFHTGTPNAKNRTGQPIISWLKKEKANKNSARTKLSDTTSVAVYPIKIISSVEMLYSILGCYLELTVAPDPASSFSSKRELSQAVLYPRTEQEQQEKSSFRFYFNSPEGASFRLLYLALRQLLDICL